MVHETEVTAPSCSSSVRAGPCVSKSHTMTCPLSHPPASRLPRRLKAQTRTLHDTSSFASITSGSSLCEKGSSKAKFIVVANYLAAQKRAGATRYRRGAELVSLG